MSLKTMSDIKFQLQVADFWAVSAKNSLKNVHGFSENEVASKKYSNFLNVCYDLLAALENKTTSETVAKNQNALPQGRQHYIKKEYSSKMKEILKHQVWTYIGVIYDTGDLVYSKQKDSLN